jgi:hypothetical protein
MEDNMLVVKQIEVDKAIAYSKHIGRPEEDAIYFASMIIDRPIQDVLDYLKKNWDYTPDEEMLKALSAKYNYNPNSPAP